MELLQLRYFLVAAQYQHITKAAEHLRIAQPALSQSIHRLEAELGVPLFTRQNRSIELNEEGRFLQQRLIPILHSLDQIPAPAVCFFPDHQPHHCLPQPSSRGKLPALSESGSG